MTRPAPSPRTARSAPPPSRPVALAAPQRSRLPALLLAAVLLAGVAAGGVWLAGGFGGGAAPVELNEPVADGGGDAGPTDADPRAVVEVGGVRRPASDVRRPDRGDADRPGPRLPDYGTIEPVPADTNANTRSVAEALRTGENPERLSALVPPTPFDPEAYEADPQAYLDVVEPGRVWQSLDPGPDVPRLRRATPPITEIVQGESVALRAKAPPGTPVTFTSFDLGAFQNRLTSITVAADEEGVAMATFTGTSGTLFDVNVLAASPAASGQLRFVVTVNPPRPSGLEGAAGGDGVAGAAGD